MGGFLIMHLSDKFFVSVFLLPYIFVFSNSDGSPSRQLARTSVRVTKPWSLFPAPPSTVHQLRHHPSKHPFQLIEFYQLFQLRQLYNTIHNLPRLPFRKSLPDIIFEKNINAGNCTFFKIFPYIFPERSIGFCGVVHF